MEEIAKLLVLAVAAALFMAFVQHGSEGPKAWWQSKFLGEETRLAGKGRR